MKFDVFGKAIEVIKSEEGWKVFYLGDEGKKRLAQDISIPAEINEHDVQTYLSDLFHESAKPSALSVKRLD